MTCNKKSPIKSLFCVEFPGKVVNVDRAIQCLGGLNKISNTFADPQGKLECRFRPDDRFSKATISDRCKSSSFVLKVTVKKKKSQTDGTENVIISTSVVGKIERVFKFHNLNDFQYLPMEKNENGVFESIYHKLIPKSVAPVPSLSQPTPIYLPPVLFSRIDSVQPYMTTKVTEETVGVIGRTRDRRSNYVKFVSHDMKEVPTTPNPLTLRYVKLKFISEEQIDLIQKFFAKRPVWTRSALACVSRVSDLQLKYLLSLNAYHFTSGPYRIAWVRFSYDPRKDPQSRKYQVLDYRLRSYVITLMKEHLPDAYTRGRTKTLRVDESNDSERVFDPFDDTFYKFRPGVIPPKKQIFYQLCDIEIPEIQEQLSQFSDTDVYDSKNGWVTEAFLEKVRETIDRLVLAAATGSSEVAEKAGSEYLPHENVEVRHEESGEERDTDLSDPEDFMDMDDL